MDALGYVVHSLTLISFEDKYCGLYTYRRETIVTRSY